LETTQPITSGPLNWGIQFYPVTLGTTIEIIIIALLLIASALISGSEVAYFSLSPEDKKKIDRKKTKIDRIVLKNLGIPEKILATILVANTFINVGIVILTAFTISSLADFSNAPVAGFIIQIVLITFFLLLFGEIAPKVYASRHALAFVRLMAFALFLLEKLFRPLNFLLLSSTSYISRRMKRHRKNISINDISQALELTSGNEISDEKDILEGIVRFGNKSVAGIMCPRVDVVAIEINTSFNDVLDVINESGYSRIPVYSGSFDQVNGILYVKDLLPHSRKSGAFKWQSLVRPPFYVPETKMINTLLEEFRKRRVHMAVVVDEYGGSSGIVTMEDILEEIVGDITDEFDEEEKFFTKISDDKFLFDAKVPLADFCKVSGVDETIFDEVKGEADTLAGLILELEGEIPLLHEKITYKNFLFSIEAVNNRRIEQIKVEIK